jgi:hypothetical protein
MTGEREVIRLPCLHLFHKNCLDDWFTRKKAKACPIDQFLLA